MKVVILAGGLGTRLSEETQLIPKPMVEIGGRPILWHIMKTYSHWGFNEFVILTGYKSHVIKDYFINYYMRYSDITVDMANNSVELHNSRNEPWKVTML
jgi:glucose-1-phosphate cytidylyltransferase